MKRKVLSDIVPNLGMWDDLPAAKPVALDVVARVSADIRLRGDAVRNVTHQGIRRYNSIRNELRTQIKYSIMRAMATGNGQGTLDMRGDVGLLSASEASIIAVDAMMEVFTPDD